jgi:hypothetical protein
LIVNIHRATSIAFLGVFAYLSPDNPQFKMGMHLVKQVFIPES